MTKKKQDNKTKINISPEMKKILDQFDWMEKFFDVELMSKVDTIEFEFAAAEAEAYQTSAGAKDISGKVVFHMRDPDVTKH